MRIAQPHHQLLAQKKPSAFRAIRQGWLGCSLKLLSNWSIRWSELSSQGCKFSPSHLDLPPMMLQVSAGDQSPFKSYWTFTGSCHTLKKLLTIKTCGFGPNAMMHTHTFFLCLYITCLGDCPNNLCVSLREPIKWAGWNIRWLIVTVIFFVLLLRC